MASRIVDRLMIEQRRVPGEPVLTNLRGIDFDEWLLELDEPSRTRLERFLELAADATAVGKGWMDAEPLKRRNAVASQLRQID